MLTATDLLYEFLALNPIHDIKPAPMRKAVSPVTGHRRIKISAPKVIHSI